MLSPLCGSNCNRIFYQILVSDDVILWVWLYLWDNCCVGRFGRKEDVYICICWIIAVWGLYLWGERGGDPIKMQRKGFSYHKMKFYFFLFFLQQSKKNKPFILFFLISFHFFFFSLFSFQS